MTDPAMNSDLIAQLEEATEGSRELDMEIFWLAFPEYERGKDPIWHCLHYTTSIDAAMTLVPEGWWWVLNSGREAGLSRAIVGFAGKTVEADFAGGPALALCIAALKARDME